MATSVREKPWHHHITIDVLFHVLQNSIFHPFVAWLIPLCQRAVGAPGDSLNVIATCSYASLVTVIWMLSLLNTRIAYGLPREVDWNQEVVVITGGANGLGKIIAETYGMRGASVAVLDVQAPDKESDGLAGVQYYQCDIGDPEAVQGAQQQIEKDVRVAVLDVQAPDKESDGLAGVQYYQCDIGDPEAVQGAQQQIEKDLGPATILINNAGIVNGKPLLSLSSTELQKNFNVNLLAHFNTIRAFLPGMLLAATGGTIVTVASVLGKLGASHLADYTAAKAGLIAMHHSLRGELASSTAPDGADNIRMLLVTPGQLSTSLFRGMETPSTFFGPVVEPVELAREIVKKIDAGQSGEISLPLYAKYIEWLHVLPASLQKVARHLAGVDRAMEGFGQRRTAERKRQ